MLNYKSDKVRRFSYFVLAICLILGFTFIEVNAQTSSSENTNTTTSPNTKEALFQKANQYVQKQDWQNAIQTYLSITNLDPKDGRAWFRLGFSYHSLGEYEKAIEAYIKSIEIGNNPAVMYNLACTYAKTGNKDKAFEWLETIVGKGFNQIDQLKNDKDFASLHSDARYVEIVKKVEKVARPCVYSPEARQFDFWVGQWDVKTQDGNLAGTNTIQQVVGDCALIENWVDSRGGTGKSFNFYNSQTQKWHQTWIDDKGNVINFAGIYKDNSMQFQAENITSDGKKVLRKLTFYPISSDQVRQHGQVSNDNGTTWSTEYDLNYFRHK